MRLGFKLVLAMLFVAAAPIGIAGYQAIGLSRTEVAERIRELLTKSAAAMDIWGNPLDGNGNGTADGPTDDFVWTFGALDDAQAPVGISCNGPDPQPFSPDGDDKDDLSFIRFDAEDGGGLWLARLEVRDAGGSRSARFWTRPSFHEKIASWDIDACARLGERK